MKVKDLVRFIDGEIELFYDNGILIPEVLNEKQITRDIETPTDWFYNDIHKDGLMICSFTNYIVNDDDDIKAKKKDWKDAGIKWESYMANIEELADKDGKYVDYIKINDYADIMNSKVTRAIPIWWDERVITLVGIEKGE